MQKTIEDSSNPNADVPADRSLTIQEGTQSSPLLSPSSTGREREIEHHGSLVENLMKEISASRYEINHGIRYRMHQGVLRAHWDEWSSLRKRFGHAALMKKICLHTEIVGLVNLLCAHC